MRGSLLMGTCARDGGGPTSHGKPACPPKELGASKTSYASTIIGELGPFIDERPQVLCILPDSVVLLGDL